MRIWTKTSPFLGRCSGFVQMALWAVLCIASPASPVFAQTAGNSIPLVQLSSQAPANSPAAWQALKAPGAVVVFRHALAPGGGDPAGFQQGDCTTQRNLSPEGRAQAQRIGRALLQQGIAVQAMWHSPWCRARDSAVLAAQMLQLDPAKLRTEPVFGSFLNAPHLASSRTEQATQLLSAWQGSGALVVFTHQVNLTALSGVFPQSGEGVVFHREGTQLKAVARLSP